MSSSSELADLLCKNSADYAVVLFDAGGDVVSFNEAARALYGGSSASMATELWGSRESGHSLVVRCLPEGMWIEESTTALLRDDGSLAGFSRIARDASVVRELEQKAARANEELDQFAFTVSHDLQEPLRTARSYSELLKRRYKDQLDSDAGEFIEFIVDAATRMSQLLKDVLAFSQAGRPERTNLVRTDSAVILQWTLMNLSKTIAESGAKITLGPLPIVLADQTQLDTLFQILIGNSVKFRSEAALEISISAASVAGFQEFAVTDNGTGIEAQYYEKVFGVFKRLVGKSVPGTGIGLSIARKIVEAHGGKIWLGSSPSQGTTVRFTLLQHD